MPVVLVFKRVSRARRALSYVRSCLTTEFSCAGTLHDFLSDLKVSFTRAAQPNKVKKSHWNLDMISKRLHCHKKINLKVQGHRQGAISSTLFFCTVLDRYSDKVTVNETMFKVKMRTKSQCLGWQWLPLGWCMRSPQCYSFCPY